MGKKITLGKRFWRPAGISAAWALAGWGFIGFRLGLPIGGGLLLAVAAVFLALMVDGRVIHEGTFTPGQLSAFLAALAIFVLTVAPMAAGFLPGYPLWLLYLLVLVALVLLTLAEALRAYRGRTSGT